MCLRPQGANWGCLEGYSLPHCSLELFSRDLLGPQPPPGIKLRIPTSFFSRASWIAIVFCYRAVWKELRKGVNGLTHLWAQMDGGWRDLTGEERFYKTIPPLLDYAIIGKANRTQEPLYVSA